MKLQYGSYTHAIGEAAVNISRDAKFNDAGVPISVMERWTIQGMLIEESDLTTEITALIEAYSEDGKDLFLLFDDGSPTAHMLYTNLCYGGTRVVVRPSFGGDQRGEYTTYRTYNLAVEGEILDEDGSNTVVEWDETLQLIGGGPRYSFLETVNGSPVKQGVNAYTTYKAIQTGRAVGRDTWPIAPGPKFPADEHRDRRRITPGSPRKMGRGGTTQYRMFPIEWSYEFESSNQLSGLPNLWPSGS